MTADGKQRWWGEFRLATGEAATWHVGPLCLGVLRGQREWQLGYAWDPAIEESQEWEIRAGEFPAEPKHHERYVMGETEDRLFLRPALPDRAVVSSPRVPFYLLPGMETRLFVGSPAWVRIEVGPASTVLRELHTRRPSDTWFGPSTLSGELCYAMKTRATLTLDNLGLLPRTVITPLRIRNRAATPLWLEKIKLPLPLLSLYGSADGRLWTQTVGLDRDLESDDASLDISSGPPDEAEGADRLSPPRLNSAPRMLFRAFSSLFARDRETRHDE